MQLRDYQALPKSRSEAKAVKAVAYFTGAPCKNGHVAERFTTSGGCRICQEERRQAFKAAHPEKHFQRGKEYRERNADRERERQRKWGQENPDKNRAKSLRHYNRHPEKHRERTRLWHKNNPFKSAEQRATRRAREFAGGSFSASEVREIMAMQKRRCACCQEKLTDYHIDHIMPLAKGGANTRQNLQILCPDCNRRKAAKHPVNFMRERGFLL